MDEDEWEEPENLQSVRRDVAGGGTTPMGTPRRTPVDSIYGKGAVDPAEKQWEPSAEERRAARGEKAPEDTPFDWKAEMRKDGKEMMYRADGRKQTGRGRGRGESVSELFPCMVACKALEWWCS
jgi:hypothetical protein